MKRNLAGFLLFALIFNLNAGSLIKASLEEEVEEASLIVRGTLIDKYSKNDNEVVDYLVNRNGEIVSSSSGALYTTFTFKVTEVIKGEFLQTNIDVKMQGGCDQFGNCDLGFSPYSYSKGEDAVLYLKKMYKSDHYITTAGADTAFSVTDENILVKKTQDESQIKNHVMKLKDDGTLEKKVDILTLSILKTVVDNNKVIVK